MHTAVFAGHIGRDAELKSTQSGDAVASFSLGVSNGEHANSPRPNGLTARCGASAPKRSRTILPREPA